MEEHTATRVYENVDEQRQKDNAKETSEMAYNEVYIYTTVGNHHLSTNDYDLQQNIAYQPSTISKIPEVKNGMAFNDEYEELQRNAGRKNKDRGIKMPELRSTRKNEMRRAVQMMKTISLIISVIVNVVMLLLVTTVAIVGAIQNQPATGESTSIDIDSLKSQYSQLATVARSNISQLMELMHEAARNKTYFNISQILSQLDETNSNVAPALNQLATIEVSISKINTLLNRTNSDIHSAQSQVSDLQLQLHCGPGEWRRVAYLNMSDPTQQCPSAWREYNTGGVRACGRPDSTEGSCAATTHSVNLQFSRVCGRALAYQFGSTDAFNLGTIDQAYVDGISITHGSPRVHIWTYAAGATESGNSIIADNCPCSSNGGISAPSYVEDNYYCESANPENSFQHNHLFRDDKLWDGQLCEDSCCSGANTPPWFSTNLPMTTNDVIEVRICGSERTFNEDILLRVLEMYVQ